MMDFGFAELFFIIVLAVLVIGPQELPALMRGLGRIVKRFQYMRYALSRQLDDLMHDEELDAMRHDASMREETDTDESAMDEML